MNRGHRKKRTRGHIVADLAVNFVERQFLLAGHVIERTYTDYGIDLFVSTFDASGEVENGLIWIQVKGTDRLRKVDRGRAIAQQVEVAHLNHWVAEPAPVIVIVYDASLDCAYWCHIQAYFENLAGFIMPKMSNYKTLRIPVRDKLDLAAIAVIQKFERNRAT